MYGEDRHDIIKVEFWMVVSLSGGGPGRSSKGVGTGVNEGNGLHNAGLPGD